MKKPSVIRTEGFHLLLMQIRFNLGRTDLRRARQVHHLGALLLQEVELALPVVAHDEGVDASA